jgi:hypothetical protein
VEQFGQKARPPVEELLFCEPLLWPPPDDDPVTIVRMRQRIYPP